jgi:GT2 family glycosyltransferase
MSDPLVYVLVLNYCSTEDTLESINSIRQLDYPNLCLLAMDNASPDGGGDILRDNIPKDEFIQLPKNTGYAGGNNEGIRRALQEGADYVFIVNPDVRLSPDSIRSYVDIMEADKTIGALNPIQLCHDDKTIDDKFRRGIFESHQHPTPQLNKNNTEQWEVRKLYGAALMLPVVTIRKVGAFDPLYFAYGEEEDLCRRITYHGLRLVVTAKSPVRHLRTKENEGVSNFILFLRLKGSYLYKLKDLKRSFRRSLNIIVNDLKLDILGRRRHVYPFNAYAVKRKHVVKTAIWTAWHLKQIFMHRKMEKAGSAHI